MSKTKERLEQEREADEQAPDEETGDAPGEQSGKSSSVEFTPEQQETLDDIIAERLSRQREKLEREAEEQRQQARREAEEKRLEEQQEYQELAEQRKAELDDVKPQVEQLTADLERYQTAVAKRVKARLEDVPGFVKPLLEGRDPLEQWLYIEEHSSEWQAGHDGPPPSPKPDREDITDAERKQRGWKPRL
jgi:hypothetical protein